MSKFDYQIKKEIQNYLKQNVKMNNRDFTNIQEEIVKRKKTLNIVYISAFSLLFIVISISTLSMLQPKPDLDFNPSPLSTKHSAEKEVPTVDIEEKSSNETKPQGVVQDEEIEEKQKEEKDTETTETDAEREAIFMELLHKYNKLNDIEFDYDRSDNAKYERSLGYRVNGFDSKDEFLAQFSDFAAPTATSKMFNLLFDNENGLYLIASEHGIYEFYPDHAYQLEKVNEDQYSLNQTYDGPTFRYTTNFEFSRINGNWLITDWNSTLEGVEPENPLLPEIQNLMSDFLLMSYRVKYRSDIIDYLSDGREAHRILNAKNKTELYSLFEDITTLKIAKYIWEDYLVEENGELFLLGAERYYAGLFDAFDYQYTKIEDGVYEIKQRYVLESENSTYNVYFKVENVNDSFWLVTDYYFTKE